MNLTRFTDAIDLWTERRARGIARGSSRRGWLKTLGAALVGGAVLPLLPVARAQAGQRGARRH